MINMYIETCYTHNFNINEINSCDLISFLKFIDQYPSDYLSIDIIENQLVNYLKIHSIKPNDYIIKISLRYKLKVMYIFIHNYNIENQA